MADYVEIERYRLILKHEFIDKNGNTHEIEPAKVMQYMVPHIDMYDYHSHPGIFLDGMFDRFKCELMDQVRRME